MKNIKSILLFSVVMIIACFLSILIFNFPAFIKGFEISQNNNIGDTIGGITAPIIGIVSSILLFLALTKQTESNIDQKLKNEVDIIFLLLNQLDTELNSFYFKFEVMMSEEKYTGLEGLDEFAKRFGKTWEINNFKNKVVSFKSFYEAGQIIYIIDSINLIYERVNSAPISVEMKNLFYQKLNSFYESKLNDSLNKIHNRIEEYPFLKDEWTEKIKLIVEKH